MGAACLGWCLNAAGVHPAFNSSLSNDPLEAAKQLPAVGWLQFVLGCGAIEWLAEKSRIDRDTNRVMCWVQHTGSMTATKVGSIIKTKKSITDDWRWSHSWVS